MLLAYELLGVITVRISGVGTGSAANSSSYSSSTMSLIRNGWAQSSVVMKHGISSSMSFVVLPSVAKRDRASA